MWHHVAPEKPGVGRLVLEFRPTLCDLVLDFLPCFEARMATGIISPEGKG